MLTATFYHSVLPLCTVITILSLIVIYWSDKRILLRKRSYPPSLGPKLPFEMVELLEWIIVTYGLSSIFFATVLYDEFLSARSFSGYLVVFYGLLNAILPMAEFNKWLF